MQEYNQNGKLVLSHPKLGTVLAGIDHIAGVQFTHHLWSSAGSEGEKFVRKWEEEIDKLNNCLFMRFYFTYTFPRARKATEIVADYNTKTGQFTWNAGFVSQEKADAFNEEFFPWFREMVSLHMAELRAYKVSKLRQSVQGTVDAILANLKPVQAMLDRTGGAP